MNDGMDDTEGNEFSCCIGCLFLLYVQSQWVVFPCRMNYVWLWKALQGAGMLCIRWVAATIPHD